MGHIKANSNGHQWRKAKNTILKTQTYCHLCGHTVNKQLPAGHPMAPEIDHIIPLARGGAKTALSNLALTHRSCNLRKSDGTNQRPKQPLPTSQRW